MFAIIDIETCGSRYEFRKGRIIEICVVQHDGLAIESVYSTLINPECYIAPMYTKISGITNDMVQDAPTFPQIAKKILELTEGRVFVAHNVAFDYGFVKDEFASLGFGFKRDTLCTVRLSRKLLPNRVSYSLGNLCAGLGIEIENRHRAEGDAVATAKLFDLLLQAKAQNPQYRTKGIEEIMTRRIDKIKEYILNKIPEECGVYYFQNREGETIYIGKSVNMYNRAISHFNNDENKGRRMLNDLYNADWVCTGSELIALLLESTEIKKHKPPYNRARATEVFTHAITWHTNKQGITSFAITAYDEAENIIIAFSNYTSARERLDNWIEAHALCLSYCGLAEEGSACFNHQIKKCNGICCGNEDAADYNRRAGRVLDRYVFKERNFAIIDKGRTPNELSVVYIENGQYYGYGYFDQQETIYSAVELKGFVKQAPYYPDADTLIRGFLNQSKNVKIVKVAKEPETTGF